MNIIGIIPARYKSSRFPGKPLAMIGEKTMIQRVYEQAQKCKKLSAVYVATDNKVIYNHIKSFKGNVVMTREDHPSGTDRCYEALQIIERETNRNFDIVVNIQGDEPFINPDQIEKITSLFDQKREVKIATLIKSISEKEEIEDNNVVKVVTNKLGEALYFSRLPIPFYRNNESNEPQIYFKHIGLYAYKRNILKELIELPTSALEKAESLEQLRWLENGYRITTEETKYNNKGIDTYEDLLLVLKKR